MSIDNGIYILQMKDQYRVIEAQAFPDNLYWTPIDDNDREEFVPTRIVEYYGKATPVTTLAEASNIAFDLAKRAYVVEYGIQLLSVDKTWDEIVQEAKATALEEIETIKTKKRHFMSDIPKLEKILQM